MKDYKTKPHLLEPVPPGSRGCPFPRAAREVHHGPASRRGPSLRGSRAFPVRPWALVRRADRAVPSHLSGPDSRRSHAPRADPAARRGPCRRAVRATRRARSRRRGPALREAREVQIHPSGLEVRADPVLRGCPRGRVLPEEAIVVGVK
jgi:hypothetical protein